MRIGSYIMPNRFFLLFSVYYIESHTVPFREKGREIIYRKQFTRSAVLVVHIYVYIYIYMYGLNDQSGVPRVRVVCECGSFYKNLSYIFIYIRIRVIIVRGS